MAIFIYADESGVFDKKHEQFFVFGGIIFLDKKTKDTAIRKYRDVENKLRPTARSTAQGELKATTLTNKQKSSVFRSLNGVFKFAVVIHLPRVHDQIFADKKTKQRYLDYAFKRGVKSALKKLMIEGSLPADYSGHLYVVMDEHSTATNGRYELCEGIESEIKIGTWNETWNIFFPPLLPSIQSVSVEFLDSRAHSLIRAADIVANRVYYHAKNETLFDISDKVTVLILP